MGFFHHHDEDKEEIRLLKSIANNVQRLVDVFVPRLSSIKIITGDNTMAEEGPVTLNPGQSAQASVQGFDQNGQPITIDFTKDPVTWVDDNPTAATDAPSADTSTNEVTYVAPGTMNLTATCGGFSDEAQYICAAAVPVLSSIKIVPGTPTP